MAYELQENEMKLGLNFVHPSSLMTQPITREVFIKINDKNIYFQISDQIGFFIDKDIATTLLRKVGEDEVSVIKINSFDIADKIQQVLLSAIRDAETIA